MQLTREGDSSRLRPVEFDFWWPQRPELGWRVIGLRGREEISTPYEFEVELICDDPQVDPEDLLGTDCELLLDRNGLTRMFFGVVAEVDLVVAPTLERESDGVGVRVLLVPAFRLLEHEVDTRFFMGQTVIEILREHLGAALAAWGRELDVESRISGQYNRRDYCVQFRESTFAFCSRIMEEEGIAYLFVPDHDGQRETMVLVDDNSACGSVDLLVAGGLPIVSTAPEELDRETIQAFEWRRKRTPNRVVTRGYNLKSPAQYDSGQAERQDRGRPLTAEHYLDGERRQIIDDPVEDPEALQFTGAALDQRASMAMRALQRHTIEAAQGRGRSNAIGFGAGALFELAEPADATGAESKFLLVRVEHHGKVDEQLGAAHDAYQNRFECVPASQPFRPARRTPRPRVYGVQTGIVVGRTADEVYTDPLGRVRVKFHRDRSEVDGEHASCWIRVAQMWAGNGYGTMIIPRVGMEVVVSFVDGNPDCPLITGSVYHGSNAPPYPLPSELSKSTIKTRSLGGDGFNELRIEDQDGREQIFVHAQRRMDLRVRGVLYESSFGGREEVIGTSNSLDSGDLLAGSHNTLVHGMINVQAKNDLNSCVEGFESRVTKADLVEDIQQCQYTFVADLSQLNANNVVVEAASVISHKCDNLELAGSSQVGIKGGGMVVVQSNNRVELVVGQSFIALTPTSVEIGANTIRLNSGGGTIGRASDGRAAIGTGISDVVDALVADDGRPNVGGGGGGSRRKVSVRDLDPQHAPPMEPTKPTRPEGERSASGNRKILLLHWIEQEAWCSEPAQLWVDSEGYDGNTEETVIIENQVDGGVQCADVVRPTSPARSFDVQITDVVPRRIGEGVEAERELLALLVSTRTPQPIRLRFIAELPSFRYKPGYGHFDVAVRGHEIWLSRTFEYTLGWLYYVIRLGDTVPEDVGGKIGEKYLGSHDWRYCKREVDPKGGTRLVFWSGEGWVAVPKFWDDDLGTKLYGNAVWRDGDTVKTQVGTLPWPDPVPQTWTRKFPEDEPLSARLQSRAEDIEWFWSDWFDIQRNECRSHEVQCCRYRVRFSVQFEHVAKRRSGIVLAENRGRANAGVWPLDASDEVWNHEFGHHLDNPDEYPGAYGVDPTVNGDGAKAGIDDDSIMGSGTIVRRRHFNGVCKAMALAVAEHTGKTYSYRAVDPVPSSEP